MVEGGTLVLANSKPSVTSLGPLTVKRQPPRQGGPPLAVTSLAESTSGGSLRVQLTPQPWPLAFDVATVLWLGTGHRAARGRCPPLTCPTRPLSTEGPVGPLGHERPRVYGVW